MELPSYRVPIVSSVLWQVFNRGKLLNIGFNEYKDKTKYFITNDIDLNPRKKIITEYYNKEINENTVLAILTSICNTYGGIIKICNKTIDKINGFPNNIWGWGVEDKALKNRGDFYKLEKKTVLLHTDKYRDDEYFKAFNDIDDRNKKNHSHNHLKHYKLFDKLPDSYKEKVITSDGLNTLKYDVIEKKILDMEVECIKVKI